MSFPREKKYLKITLGLNKLDHLSNAEFSEYWRTTHAQVAMSLPVFMKNVRRYNQVDHSYPNHKALHGLS
jgi:hypothetical protein